MNAAPRVGQARSMIHTRSGGEQDIQRVEVGGQQRVPVEQVRVGLTVDVRRPSAAGLASPAGPDS